MENRYKTARNAYKKNIVISKDDCWRKILSELENDVWGEGFRIMQNSLNIKAPRVDLDLQKRTEVARTLFPVKPVEAWEARDSDNPVQISTEEVIAAANKLKSKKAPGPDGIPVEIIKDLVEERAVLVRSVFNDLLDSQKFPAI